MEREALKKALLKLSPSEQTPLIKEVEQGKIQDDLVISSLYAKLDNKQGRCLDCRSFKYNKFGIDKGSRRFRCKECKRAFTEYKGTWLSKIRKKALAGAYIKLMGAELFWDIRFN